MTAPLADDADLAWLGSSTSTHRPRRPRASRPSRNARTSSLERAFSRLARSNGRASSCTPSRQVATETRLPEHTCDGSDVSCVSGRRANPDARARRVDHLPCGSRSRGAGTPSSAPLNGSPGRSARRSASCRIGKHRRGLAQSHHEPQSRHRPRHGRPAEPVPKTPRFRRFPRPSRYDPRFAD